MGKVYRLTDYGKRFLGNTKKNTEYNWKTSDAYRITNYLDMAPRSSREDIASGLGMNPMEVGGHIINLKKSGIVKEENE